MTHLALLLTSTTIVVLAGFLLAVLMRPGSFGEALVGTGVLSISLIEVDSLLVGGLLESYRPGPLLLGACGLLLITASPLISRQGRLAAVDAAHLVGVGLSECMRHGLRHRVVALLGVAVFAAYGVRAYLSIRLPNVDWDGLMYHLVGVDEWITRGRITHSSLVLWADVYPQSVELFVGWTSVNLHNTIYAGISQGPIFLIGAASTAGLARRIGARRSHAVLAGLLFLATPAVLVQFGTNYVDAAAASLALAALYLVTGLRRAVELDPDNRTLWAARLATAGVVAGLACGAKSSNLLLVPFLVLYVLAVQWKVMGSASPSTAVRARHLLRRGWAGPPGILLFGLAALATGGYWYLRTWIKFGNPLYPFFFAGLPGRGTIQDLIIGYNTPEQLLGRNIVEQIAISWASDFHLRHTVTYDQRLGGLGMQWALIVVPMAVIATVVWWRGGRRGPAGLLMLILLCAAAASPATWWARYILLGAGLAAALSGHALTWLGQRLRGRVAVHAVASITLLALVATSMLSATRSVPYQMKGRSGFLDLGSALKLAARDDRSTLLFPWYLYQPVDQVPNRFPIAVVGDGSARFTHVFFGNHVEHDVVAIGAVGTTDQLSATLSSGDLHFVVIDDGAPALLRQAVADVARFRLLNAPAVGVQPRPYYLFKYSDPPNTPRKGS